MRDFGGLRLWPFAAFVWQLWFLDKFAFFHVPPIGLHLQVGDSLPEMTIFI
jgi:hypothetical protein